MPQLRRDFFRTIEAGITGLFFVQAIRYGFTMLYAHASSADLEGRVLDSSALAGVPGVIEQATFQRELAAMIALLFLPVLALAIRRWRISLPFAVMLVALGRSMAIQIPDFEVPGAALIVGGGLLYLALTAIWRPALFGPTLLLGLTGDQLIRALGHTLDRTWQGDHSISIAGRVDLEMGLIIPAVSIALILLSLLVWSAERRQAHEEQQQEGYSPPLQGSLNVWGALALGAILYLELALLGLPNAVAHWANTDYAGIVPWLLGATALPLVPEVRDVARRFAGMFDGVWRGWLWALLLGFLLVVGRRYDGIMAGLALVFAQFMVGLTLWWLVQTGLPRRNFTGFTILFSAVSFAVLALGDYFTYDYAYVRDLSEPYENVADFLRSFRDMGLGLTLIAAFVLSIPMILARRRIPWRGGRPITTLAALALVVVVSLAGTSIASPEVVRRPPNVDCLRAATFNLHGGYSQFFDSNLERAAHLVELNGVDIVLLQEVETGRLASFGVDQAMWLARRLDMEWAFYPQNEELQGLAVLSRVPIEDVEGLLLPSEGNQAAVMHVALAPERLTADPLAADVGDLHIYNAWLGFRAAERDGSPVPEGEQDQNRQMETLLNWVAARHGPGWTDRVLLGGTFNYGPDSPLYNVLRLGEMENPAIKDPFAGLRAEDAKTVFLVDGTAARYDYLWTFNLPLTGAMVDQSPEAANTSDHRSAIVAIARREGITCPP